MRELAGKILAAEKGKTHLFSLGQAGYVIKSPSGQLLGIDLYLSDCVERAEGHMGYKRLLPKMLGPDELEFEAVVATHPHLDHFDMDAIPGLMGDGGGRTRLFATVGCKKLVEQAYLEYFHDRIIYVKPGDVHTVSDFRISFVNCDHGEGAPDAVGVVAETGGKRVYEAGDTCLRLDRVEEIRRFGEIDILIVPINGAYGNLDECGAAELSNALNPGLTIPCHYGMFASHGGNPGKFFDVMRERYPGQEVLLMGQGGHLEL